MNNVHRISDREKMNISNDGKSEAKPWLQEMKVVYNLEASSMIVCQLDMR